MPLSRLPRLRHLSITWSTKIADLEWLRALTGLRTLALDDVRPVDDLSPIAELRSLETLVIRSGVWSKLAVRSLAPLADLPSLRRADLLIEKIEEGGLRPLARCLNLQELGLGSRHPVEEYAYLLAKRPDIRCNKFAPWLAFKSEALSKDRLAIGRGRGFLDSQKDAAKLRRYEEEFERLRARFAAEEE